MAHWNYGQMTIKTWVELCPDFELFFFKKNHILFILIIHFLIFKIFKTDLSKKKVCAASCIWTWDLLLANPVLCLWANRDCCECTEKPNIINHNECIWKLGFRKYALRQIHNSEINLFFFTCDRSDHWSDHRSDH